MKHQKKLRTVEDVLFGVGLILFCVVVVAWPIFIKSAPGLNLKCQFYAAIGLYCPACGGTRAFNALLHGKFLQSLKFNPAVLYGVAVFVIFMVSQAVERLSHHRYKTGLKYRNIYVYVWLGILLLWWLIRNIYILI